MRLKHTALALLVCLAAPGAALANDVPLRENGYINSILIETRVADKIRKQCPSINARMVRALSEAYKLKNYALSQGYSETEVRAFLESRVEKDRIYALADQRLSKNGAIEGQAESYCIAGRHEISAKTFAGSLLQER